jgi:hypothetical protein
LSYLNYVRVRVMFPLADALVPETKVRIRGRGDMKVTIRYENVLFFCFICGRIGHSAQDCADGDVGAGVFNFGVELRASPPKRFREVKVQVKPAAACFLNFEGAQRAKLQDEAISARRTAYGGVSAGHGQSARVPVDEVVHDRSIPHEEENKLMKGVRELGVTYADSNEPLGPVLGPDGVQQRVSLGTNLTSDDDPSMGVSISLGVTIQYMEVERFDGTQQATTEGQQGRKTGPTRNDEKFKRLRSSPYQRPKRHGDAFPKAGADDVGAVDRGEEAVEKREDKVMVHEGLGDGTLLSNPAEPNILTGPRIEARQEQ